MIKLFEQFNNEQKIHDICKKYRIENYTINDNGSIDVNGDVKLSYIKLNKLPLRFNKVSGDFYCYKNQLTSLKGCPKEVGGSFFCYSNVLTSLEGCPNYVGGDFSCSYNKLTSLEGYPKEVGGGFYCANNKLTSLELCPSYVSGEFSCSNNKLTSLKGCPKEVGGSFYCYSNKLKSLEGCPNYIYVNFNFSDNPINKIDAECDISGNIVLDNTKLDNKIKKLDQYYLRMLLKHYLDYNIFNEDGTINDKQFQHFKNDFEKK